MSNNDPLAPNRVFVGGISWKADEASLANFFQNLGYGKVIDCKIIMDKTTGKSKGYGFVTFDSPESAKQVKQSTNLYFLGKMMNVGDAVRKSDTKYYSQLQQQQQQLPPQIFPYSDPNFPYFFNQGFPASPFQQPFFPAMPIQYQPIYQGIPFEAGLEQGNFQQGWQPIHPPNLYQQQQQQPPLSPENVPPQFQNGNEFQSMSQQKANQLQQRNSDSQ